VKDAHDSGRNLITTLLPADVTLIREWSGHPFSMIQELDETFAGLVMIGHHASVGSEGNSLAHTLNTRTHMITLNGKPVSEFRLCALSAASLGVPVVFISGDKALMEEVEQTNSHIGRLAVKRAGAIHHFHDAAGGAKCHPAGSKVLARKIEDCLARRNLPRT
jgi:D-amino peptidase